MLRMDNFPIFYNDAEATCFSCDAPTINARRSDYAKGRGARVADCSKCNMSTWFDVHDSHVLASAVK